MKRILSILMAVAMVACLLPTAAIATGEAFSVSVVAQNGDLTGVKAGETVTATVKLPVDTQIGGSTIQLTYDSNYFTVTSATSDFGKTPVTSVTGKVTVTYLDTDGVNHAFTTSQALLTVVFTAKAGAHGTSAIALTKYDCGAYSGTTLTDYGYTAPAATNVTVIEELTGAQAVTIAKPAKNGTPIGDFSTAQYDAAITWSPAIAAGGTFAANTLYTANVILTAKTGYKFASTATATVADATVSGSTVASNGSTLSFKAAFPKTDSRAITGLTVTTQPTKMTYSHGDAFDPAGMVVSAAYDDGTTDAAFTGYTVSYESVNNYLRMGNTKVTLSAEGKTVDVTALTVNAKALTVTGAAVAATKVYDGTTDAAITANGALNGVASGDAVTLTTGTAAYADKNVGDGKAVTFTGYSISGTDAGNYTLSQPAAATAAITAKPLTVTGAAVAATKEYDGNSTANITTAGTLTSVVSGDTVTLTTGTAAYADKNVGTGKTVTFSGYSIDGADKGNYTLSQPADTTAAITAKAVTITPTAGQTKVYGEADPALTYTTDLTGALATDFDNAKAGALSRAAGENVGSSYAINIGTLAAGSNFTLSLSGTVNFSITAFTDVEDTTTTGTSTNPITVIHGVGGFAPATFMGVGEEAATGTTTYSYGSVTNGTHDEMVNALKNLATGTTGSISYTFTGSGNYAGASKTGTIYFKVVDIAFTVGSESATETNAVTEATSPVYGMTWAQLVTIKSSIVAKVGAETVSGGTYSLMLGATPVNGSAVPDAGTYNYTVVFTKGTEYVNVTVCSGSITVAKKTLTDVSVTGTYTYNGSAQTPAVTVKDGTKTLTSTTDYTVAYSNNIDAGTATATVTGAGNYTGTPTVNFTIAPRPLTGATVTIGGTYTYTGAAQTPAVTVKDGTKTLTSTTDYTVAYSNNIDAGTATVTVTGNGNYSGTAAGTYTIARRAVTITPDAKSKTYGAADPTLTYTASGLVNPDKVTGTLSRVTGEYAGTYLINGISGLTAGDNYTLNLSSSYANFTITQATYVLSGIPATLYIGSTFNADTIKNAVKDCGDVTITGVQVQKSDGTVVTGTDADAIATVGAFNAVTAKGAGKVVVAYNIAANNIDADGYAEYNASGSQTVTLTLTAAPVISGGGVSSYTLTFNTNGGSAVAAVSGKSGDVIDLAAYVPTMDGYTFAGWYSDAGLTAAVTSVKLTSSATVYAKWTKNAAGPFTDVPDDAFFAKPVAWAAGAGVTGGTSATTFSPDEDCTRAQAVTFIWKVLGSQEPVSKTNPFTDVSAEDYYYKAVLWAVENGITKGATDTTFAPNDTVTRAQFVTFLWRAANAPAASGTNPFTDVTDSGAYYYQAVLWALQQDVTSGTTPTTFGPEDNCSRGQVVTFLYGYISK